jgi:peptidyl-prolyl cis-trans isomerase D
MLDSLRKSAGTWVVKIFLGILVLSFAIWGIGDIFRLQPSSAVVTVGDVTVTGEQFIQEFNADVRRLQRQFGPTFDSEQARALGFVDRTIDRLTQRSLYDQEVGRLGLTITNDDILRQIRGNAMFQNDLGSFDRFRFEQILAQNGFTEESYIAATRRDSSRSQLVSAVTGGVVGPNPLVDAIYRYRQEKRVFEMLTLNQAAISDIVEPEESELAEYHKNNEGKFMAPSYRTVTYLTLRPEQLTGEIHISDDDIADAYENRKAEFTKMELRTVEQIVVQDKEKATAIAGRLSEGGEFYAVAKSMADLDEEALKLGEVTRDDLPEEVVETVFGLQVDAISPAVESALGWHVFRVRKIVPGGVTPLSEARETISADLKLERAQDAIFDLANKIEDELAGGSDVEETAQALSLTHGRLVDVDANGRNRAGEPFGNLPKAPEFLRSVFDANIGDELELKESEDGSYFLFRVDNVVESALRPLDTVRDKVKQALLDEKRAEAAKVEIAELAEKVKGGADLKSLADGVKITYATSKPVILTETPRETGINAQVAAELFKGRIGASSAGGSSDGKSQILARVSKIEEADPAKNPDPVEQLRLQLVQSISNDLVQLFEQTLQDEYSVEVDRTIIDALFDATTSQPNYAN